MGLYSWCTVGWVCIAGALVGLVCSAGALVGLVCLAKHREKEKKNGTHKLYYDSLTKSNMSAGLFSSPW